VRPAVARSVANGVCLWFRNTIIAYVFDPNVHLLSIQSHFLVICIFHAKLLYLNMICILRRIYLLR
jgi:uncharacterized membrane protein